MCFSLAAVEQFLIWLVIVCVLIGIIKIFVPWILSLAGIGIDGKVAQLINLVIIGAIIIFAIIIVFWLLECLLGGGFGMGRIR
jgi:hypothetical protein